jgi:hypothetical protein
VLSSGIGESLSRLFVPGEDTNGESVHVVQFFGISNINTQDRWRLGPGDSSADRDHVTEVTVEIVVGRDNRHVHAKSDGLKFVLSDTSLRNHVTGGGQKNGRGGDRS